MANKPNRDVSAVKDMLGGLSKDVVKASNKDTGDARALRKANVQLDEARTQLKNALISQENGSWLLFGQVRLTKTGLEVPSSFSPEDLDLLGDILAEFNDRSQFWVGDWANHYIDETMDNLEIGIVYRKISNKRGLDPKTISDYANICLKIPPPLRNGGLKFSHHRVVAYLPESLKGREEEFLNAAVENKWSVRELREEIQKERDKLNPPHQPDTLIDTKHMFKQFRQVTKLFSADVSMFSAKKRDEYRGKVAALESILQDLKNKLDE